MEYIVFKGPNHSERHAAALVEFLHGLRVHINLIPYHPIGNIPLNATPTREMIIFQDQLQDRGLMTTIRRSRGLDIDATCGMLSTKKLAEAQKVDTLDY